MEIIQSPLYRASFDTSMTCLLISRNWYERMKNPPRRICMVDLLDAKAVDATLNALGAGVHLHKSLVKVMGDTMQLFGWRDEDNVAQLVLVDYAPEELEQERLAKKHGKSPAENSTIAATGSNSDEHTQNDTAHVKTSSQQYQILAAAGDGIYGVDKQGRTIFANTATTQMLGWCNKKIIGQKLHDSHHHSHADGRKYAREDSPIFQSLTDGQVHRVDNEVFWHEDGSCIPVEYVSTPIIENDMVTGAVVVFRDISERKLREQQHEQALTAIQHQKEALELERDYLRDEIKAHRHYGEIIGKSPALQRAQAQIEAVAATPSSVLILGESGAGKEIIARAIHNNSDRKDAPLVKVNCASIAKDLFDRELFGHIKEAAPGALRNHIGRLQLADGGTLFLDEVGEMPMDQQGKLLRALQEQTFEQAGDDHTQNVNVRVIATSNQDLLQATREGKFREDLYYHLSVFPITIAPLRERTQDIAPLAQHFLQLSCDELGRDQLAMSKRHIDTLCTHNWPGNIRELKNVIERAVILSPQTRLRLDLAMPEVAPPMNHDSGASESDDDFLSDVQFKELEKANMLKALRHCGWKIAGRDGTAAQMGLKPSTLAYRMKLFGIERSSH